MSEPSGVRYAAPALEKGLDILEALANVDKGLTLSELAGALNRSVSEIFRMAQTLQRRGWVLTDAGDRFRLSMHMFDLAHRQRPLRSLTEAALPLMQEVASKTQQSCHLTLVENGRVLVVAQVDSPGMLNFSVRTGSVMSMFNTSSGHVLMAFRSSEERQRMIDTHVMVMGLSGPLPKNLNSLIEAVAERGYAHEPSEQVMGVTNLAFPIFDRQGHAIAAIVIPYMEGLGATKGISMEDAIAVLRQAAHTLSSRMGHQNSA